MEHLLHSIVADNLTPGQAEAIIESLDLLWLRERPAERRTNHVEAVEVDDDTRIHIITEARACPTTHVFVFVSMSLRCRPNFHQTSRGQCKQPTRSIWRRTT